MSAPPRYRAVIRHKHMDRAKAVMLKVDGQRERQLVMCQTRPEADLCLATIKNALEKFPVLAAAPVMLETLKDVVLALGTVGEVSEGQFQRIKDAITEADGWDG